MFLVQVRKFFPEAWLWGFVDVDPSGQSNIAVSAPDTITTWQMSAFGISADQGLGVSVGGSELTVFKDFFVELALPYQIIRGEAAVVRVGVFSALADDTDVTVTLSVPTASQGLVKVRQRLNVP
jgi:uncharacterized protein YfaS (alpha-2-macroglobulin family)